MFGLRMWECLGYGCGDFWIRDLGNSGLGYRHIWVRGVGMFGLGVWECFSEECGNVWVSSVKIFE